MADRFFIVLTALPTVTKARRLSRLLLQKKLAACVNLLGPAESSFWWEGKLDHAKEYLLLIKTRSNLFPRLQKFIEEIHPYSVPEIVALPIRKGNSAYLSWIQASVKAK